MSDGMGREPAYLSSHATNRYFIPNWGIKYTQAKLDGNRMLLVSHRNKLPFYVNGRIESYSNTTSYFELTTNNGVLHCSFYKYVIEHYNKDMKYESTDTFGLHDQYPGPCVERDLFNDDW